MRISSNTITYNDSVVQIANIDSVDIIDKPFYGKKSKERDAEYEKFKSDIGIKYNNKYDKWELKNKKQNKINLIIFLIIIFFSVFQGIVTYNNSSYFYSEEGSFFQIDLETGSNIIGIFHPVFIYYFMEEYFVRLFEFFPPIFQLDLSRWWNLSKSDPVAGATIWSFQIFISLFFPLFIYSIIMTLTSPKPQYYMDYIKKKSDSKLDKEYAIQLILSSGNANVFWTPNKEYIHFIKASIIEAMNSKDDPNFSVTIDQSKLIDNSTTNNVTNVHNDYSITIENYEGVSDKDMTFFKNDLNKTLQELGKSIESLNHQDLTDAVKELSSDFNNPEPDATKIGKRWKQITGLLETYDKADIAVKAGATVMAGLGMITSLFG